MELHTPGTAADLQQFICEMNSGASCPIWQGLSGTVPNFEKGGGIYCTGDLIAEKIKIQEIGWSAEHERAFAECKELLRNAVTLAFPDPNKMLCFFTDASEYAWGAILT